MRDIISIPLVEILLQQVSVKNNVIRECSVPMLKPSANCINMFILLQLVLTYVCTRWWYNIIETCRSSALTSYMNLIWCICWYNTKK